MSNNYCIRRFALGTIIRASDVFRRQKPSILVCFFLFFLIGPLISRTANWPHQKHTRNWVLDWAWNNDSQMSPIPNFGGESVKFGSDFRPPVDFMSTYCRNEATYMKSWQTLCRPRPWAPTSMDKGALAPFLSPWKCWKVYFAAKVV